MYIVRTERKVSTFYLDDGRDLKSFEELLNDPSINIIERKYDKRSEIEFEGEAQKVNERPYVRVEYEICSL